MASFKRGKLIVMKWSLGGETLTLKNSFLLPSDFNLKLRFNTGLNPAGLLALFRKVFPILSLIFHKEQKMQPFICKKGELRPSNIVSAVDFKLFRRLYCSTINKQKRKSSGKKV